MIQYKSSRKTFYGEWFNTTRSIMKVIKPHDYHFRISFVVHKIYYWITKLSNGNYRLWFWSHNILLSMILGHNYTIHDAIQSNLCLIANKFSPKYHDLKIYEFIWWNISYLHSFIFCLLISLQETCVYAWHILASKPLHNGLSADNTKSSDFWYFKEILSFLHSGSFRHFFTMYAFTFQYKTILSTLFHQQKLDSDFGLLILRNFCSLICNGCENACHKISEVSLQIRLYHVASKLYIKWVFKLFKKINPGLFSRYLTSKQKRKWLLMILIRYIYSKYFI